MSSLMIETLTPTEIAKMLRIHRLSVARLARQGKLPAVKVGGVWRFRRDEFERWLKRQSNNGGQSSRKRS
jgi:excisionase family DNA binding protein